jgi:mannose-6-phosphate isomerase
MQVYPIKFDPIFKDRIWGGGKLRQVLKKQVEGDSVGESWEISGVPGDESIVVNGPYKGRTLTSLLQEFSEALLGSQIVRQRGPDFPVLIKFLDAREDLSIQLHPDDALAKKRHNSPGKTEMWYIMDADPGARLIVGFKEAVSRETYEEAIDSGTLTDLLHYREVKPGEAFFIESGTVHAIGGGILLAEIQQTSDVTYRVYDFERTDAEGNQRELHTDLALEAMDFGPNDSFVLDYDKFSNRVNKVAECPYFKTYYLNLDSPLVRDFGPQNAFRILICISGQAEVRCGNRTELLRKGETILIPAAAPDLTLISDSCELLEVTL